MEVNRDGLSVSGSRTYRILRSLFIAGFALSSVLYFIPWYTPTGDALRAWLAIGGVERHLSSFDLCRLLVSTGNVQSGAFYLFMSAVEVVLMLLAIWRPRRGVFLAGACEQLYTLIAFLLRPTVNDLPQPLISVFLYYASWGMCLMGFFVRPPTKRTVAPSTDGSTLLR
jgi:hypothetical protein